MPLNGFLRQRAHPIVASFNYHKVLLYGLVSTIAVSATITNALRYHSNFYSVAIYLSKSNRSVLVRGVLIVILSVLKQLSDTCKFRSSYCIVVWAARATDILWCSSSSGGGGSFYCIDDRFCAKLSLAALWPTMVFHHRIFTGVHNIPGWLWYSVCLDVRLFAVC